MKRFQFFITLLIVFLGCSEEKELSRGFDEEKFTQLNQLDRYNYDRVIEPTTNPVLEFLIDVIRVIASFFNSYLGYIVLLLIIILLAWILYKTVKIPEADQLEQDDGNLILHKPEDIEVIDYDRLFLEAIKRSDYRLAIRYLYLGSLKQLHQAELIRWKKDKTNYEYYWELPEERRHHFRGLYQIYEYVWYGEFQADSQQVDRIKGLKNQLEGKRD